MSPDQVIGYFGGQTAAAKALGVAQSSVAGWIDNGKVPETRQYQIELATYGALKADEPALRGDVPSPQPRPNPKSASTGAAWPSGATATPREVVGG